MTQSTRFSRPLALLMAGAFFMENLDATIIQTAAPAMAADFGVAAVDISITMVSYLLAVAVVIPATGWLADRFGERRVFLVAIVLFTAASVACAFAPSLAALTAARAVQGVGGALMVPVGRLVVLRDVSPSELLDAIAYLTWPALLAPVIAPAVGGLISDTVGWRWIFLINIPVGVVAFIAGAALVRSSGSHRDSRFDTRGFLALASTLVLITLGAQLVATAGSTAVIAGSLAVVVGTMIGAATVITMLRRERALFDWRVMRLRSFRAGNVSGGVYRLIITGAPLLFTLLLQVGFGWSATAAGFTVIAVFAGNIMIKPATSPLLRRFGFRRILIAANALGMLALVAAALVRPHTPIWVILAVFFASGVFRSVGFSAYNTLQFADIDPPQVNNANTLSSTLQQAATALGVAAVAVFVAAGDTLTEGAGASEWPGYSVALLIAAALLALPLVGAVRLPVDAGARAATLRSPASSPAPSPPPDR